MPNLTLPVYDNELKELKVHSNLKAAKDWLKKIKIDTSGTTILIPFLDSNKIHFLKPSNPDSFLDSHKPAQDKESNKNIRIIGAANSIHIHGFIEKIKAALDENRVPHLNELEEEALSLVVHGFIIIYEKGEDRVGHQFAQLFQEEKQSLLKKIEDAQKNNAPHINPTEFLEKISKLAMDLDVKQGMTYFVMTDKQGIQHVYRQIFKQDPNNNKVNKIFEQEKKEHESIEVVVDEHKSQNHHIIQFLKDWCKWTVFSVITAIGAGLILGFFFAPPIGTIAASLVSVITFVGLSAYGFYRADKNNPATTEFGEFEIKSQNAFDRLKQLIYRVSDFFSKKRVNTLASPIVANDNSIGETENPIPVRNVQDQNLNLKPFSEEEKTSNSVEVPPSRALRM